MPKVSNVYSMGSKKYPDREAVEYIFGKRINSRTPQFDLHTRHTFVHR